METINKNQQLDSSHGIVASYPNQFYGYFGWPTLTRMPDGTLLAAASGLRNYHVCPFGRTTICTSNDNGNTWTSPKVINDSPFDDRDAGILSIKENDLILSWFTTDNRSAIPSKYEKSLSDWEAKIWEQGMSSMTDQAVTDFVGSWIRTSANAGLSWSEKVRVSVSAPHGPIKLSNNDLLYLGTETDRDRLETLQAGPPSPKQITAIKSTDFGKTWIKLGNVPTNPNTFTGSFNEPHCLELSDGKILGLIRNDPNSHEYKTRQPGETDFTMYQTISEDGGTTWSEAAPLGFHGSPPHLIKHSSGKIICVYSYREKPYGIRVMISQDNAKSWAYNYIIRDDGVHPDLGYPSSVELSDGSIITMYYQKLNSVDEKCSLLFTRWKLPI